MEKEVRSTRSGNAHIHGMTWVSTALLAYVATQVSLLWHSIHISPIDCWAFGSFTSRCRLHQYFQELTPQLILNNFTWASSTSWITQMSKMKSAIYWTGGTGCNSSILFILLKLILFFYSQVFLGYVTRENTVTKQSALARLKEKRAQQCQNVEPWPIWIKYGFSCISCSLR